MFLSQRPNTDPIPWVNEDGLRERRPAYISGNFPHAEPIFDPRPEFTQTRDPKPYEFEDVRLTRMAFEQSKARLGALSGAVWSPRHEEFDTPVNPILAEFRHNLRTNPSLGLGLAEGYLRWSEAGSGEPKWTAEERNHARRVLSKLVAVYGG